MSEKKLETPTFRGVPLVKKGDTLYYGDPSGKFLILLKILEKEKVNELDVSTSVDIELVMNNPALSEKERLIKKAHREGLYKALDIAEIWLEDALNA